VPGIITTSHFRNNLIRILRRTDNKKYYNKTKPAAMRKLIFILILLLAVGKLTINAQPIPEEKYTENESGYGPLGGTAPIGGGITLLIGLAAAYGIKKHQLNGYRS